MAPFSCGKRVRASFERRFASIANKYRDKLVELYGEKAGKQVQYAEAFEENEIDLEIVPHLDHEVLKDVGVVAAGHRIRLLKAAELLSGRAPGAPRPRR